MTIHNAIRMNFANSQSLDPRWTFSRGGPAYTRDRLGVIRTTPANHPRFEYDLNGLCLGALFESGGTNRALQSRTLDNASWTKTNANITPDGAAAFDGTNVLDLVSMTGDGGVSQAATISATNNICYSTFARPGASNWIRLGLADGTNTVYAWFNVSTGALGTNTAGGATCAYLDKYIESWGDGLYRIWLSVTTSVNTSYTMSAAPCAADNTAPANADTAYLGDFQFEVARTPSSPIITTTGQGSRSVDVFNIGLNNAPWWNTLEGTIGIDFVMTGRRSASGTNVLFGYSDNAGFDNTTYVTFDQITQQMFLTIISGGSGQATLSGSSATLWTPGSRNRVIIAWKANDSALCVNGNTPVVDTLVTLPVLDSGARLTLGGAPWQSNSGTGCNTAITAFEYWPRRMSGTFMQAWSKV